MKRVYDLTHEVYSGMEVYPGDPEVKISTATSIPKYGYKVSRLEFGSHNSTHIDAQSHMVEGGKTLSDYSVDRFVGEGIYVTKEDEVRTGEVIVVDGPKFSSGLINKIIELSPKMVGFVSDNDLDEEGIRRFLQEDILPVGPLNIEQKLPDSFLFIATPLKIKDGDGCPVRAIAIEYK